MAKFATNASGAIWWPNLQLMQVAPSGGQICSQYKWRHLVAKFGTNASGAIWCSNLQLMQVVPYCGAIMWPNLQQMQVAPSGGQVYKKCK